MRFVLPRSVLNAAVLVAAAIAIASVARPLLHSGFPSGHDLSAHVTYTYLFDRAIRQGQFPVRWVEGTTNGSSQPLFNFYQPGLYYLVELTRAITGHLSDALKLTVLALWWIGSLFLFLWRRRDGVLAAATGAVVFALSPYLILDVFVRAAYPELAAIACAPAVLWSIDGWTRSERPGYLVSIAVCLGVMLVCHLPSCLIFLPVFSAFAIYRLVANGSRLTSVIPLAGAAIGGLGLSAFYVWPALGEQPYVQMSALTRDYFDFHKHFVYPSQWVRYAWGYGGSVPGPDDTLSFQVGVIQWCAVAGALIWAVVAVARSRITATAKTMVFWLSVVAFALFMMTRASSVVWDRVTPLAYLQFPWRFSMLVTVGAAVLTATLLASIRNPRARGIMALCVVLAQFQFSHGYLAPERYVPEFLMDIDVPGWCAQGAGHALAFREAGYDPVGVHQPAPAGIGRWTLADGRGSARALAMEDDRMSLDVKAESPLTLTINSRAFPGWRVWMDGSEIAFDTQPGSGYIVARVPPGRHRIDAALTNTPVRAEANAVSRLSAAGVLALAAYAVWRERRAQTSRAGCCTFNEPARNHR
jgi:hypothetical protein